MVEDHRWLELAGQFAHAPSPLFLGRESVFRGPASTAEEVKVVAAEQEETLGADFEKMRAEVLHVDQGVLLALCRMRLAGPVNDLAGFCIEDSHQFRVRTRLGAGSPAVMIALYPLFLVAFSVQVDAKRQETGSAFRVLQDIPLNNRGDRRLRMRNEFVEVALPGAPPPAAAVVARQLRSD